jgi:hypothetical protein
MGGRPEALEEAVFRAGREIENENNNVLKNHGYNL